VEERARVAARPGRPRGADDLDLRPADARPKAFRCVTVLLWPVLPASSERPCSRRSARRSVARSSAALGTGGSSIVNPLEPLFPKERREQLGRGRRGVIDPHTHLHTCV